MISLDKGPEVTETKYVAARDRQIGVGPTARPLGRSKRSSFLGRTLSACRAKTLLDARGGLLPRQDLEHAFLRAANRFLGLSGFESVPLL